MTFSSPSPAAAAPSSTPHTGGVDAAPAWQEIPVFIINRNRLGALRRLVDWLLAAGTRRIVILDNASDYPPLLSYYAQLPEGAKVLLMQANHGPYVLWEQGVHRQLDTPYVVTDSDVVPADFCPSDLIGRLWEHLQRYPDAKKVGTGLRIDNLPDGYIEADTVRKWESQFWEHPVAPGVFAAPIDTTFALYPARGEFSNEACNLRLGYPYIAEHTPWYAEDAALSDEERYYRRHTSPVYSNWSVTGKVGWVDKSARVVGFERRAKVLNLDAFGEYIPGWTNVAPAGRTADLAFDWAQVPSGRLPIDDDTFDGIRVNHVLQDARDASGLLDELHRVAKPGAKLQIRVPHGCAADAWHDPMQRRAWYEGSFALLAQPTLPAAPSIACRGDWSVHELRSVEVETARGSQPRELIATLVAVKPARPRGGSADAAAQRSVQTTDDRVDPRFQPV